MSVYRYSLVVYSAVKNEKLQKLLDGLAETYLNMSTVPRVEVGLTVDEDDMVEPA